MLRNTFSHKNLTKNYRAIQTGHNDTNGLLTEFLCVYPL